MSDKRVIGFSAYEEIGISIINPRATIDGFAIVTIYEEISDYKKSMDAYTYPGNIFVLALKSAPSSKDRVIDIFKREFPQFAERFEKVRVLA